MSPATIQFSYYRHKDRSLFHKMQINFSVNILSEICTIAVLLQYALWAYGAVM